MAASQGGRVFRRVFLAVVGLLVVTVVVVALMSGSDETDSTSTPGAASTTSATQEKQSGVVVSRSEYGERWPLTVAEGLLACNDDAVTFAANGQTYGLNGFALQAGFPRPDPIWAKNPAVPGTKKDIGVLIDRGLELCGG